MFLILEGELRFGSERYKLRANDVIACPTGGPAFEERGIAFEMKLAPCPPVTGARVELRRSITSLSPSPLPLREGARGEALPRRALARADSFLRGVRRVVVVRTLPAMVSPARRLYVLVPTGRWAPIHPPKRGPSNRRNSVLFPHGTTFRFPPRFRSLD